MFKSRTSALLLLPLLLAADATTAPSRDSSRMDADGTMRVTRIVPVPPTISPEARAFISRSFPDEVTPSTAPSIAPTSSLSVAATRPAVTENWQTRAGREMAAAFPIHIVDATIAGVPVRDVMPVDAAPMHPDSVLINLHGGGFRHDAGSFTESIPLANLTHTRVIAVLYRLAPEHLYPAALEDAVAVYRELLKTYKPAHIAIYGTSAGATLTAQVAVRLKQLGLPQPAALGIFSGIGDYARWSDTHALFTAHGLAGHMDPPDSPPGQSIDPDYFGPADPRDPVISPFYADLHGLPPTLFMSSGRDVQLSDTALLHRAFLRSGVDARLIVFEALPHAFWGNFHLPESREAYGYMADFLGGHVNSTP